MLDVEASIGDGLIHFTQSGPHWDGDELEKIARLSDARWLLWRSGGEADPMANGIKLFDDRDWGEFSDTVCALLAHNALRSNLGSRARWTAETYFSWTVIAERAYESSMTVAGRPADKLNAQRSMSAI